MTDTLNQPPEVVRRRRRAWRGTIILMIAFATAKAISLAQTFIIASVFGVGDRVGRVRHREPHPRADRPADRRWRAQLCVHPDLQQLPRPARYRARLAAGQRRGNTVFLVTLALSILGFVARPWCRTSSRPASTQKVDQTVKLMRILLISTLVFSISGIFQEFCTASTTFCCPRWRRSCLTSAFCSASRS